MEKVEETLDYLDSISTLSIYDIGYLKALVKVARASKAYVENPIIMDIRNIVHALKELGDL